MRRLLSLLGIVVIVALALMLLWRVYLHHETAEPYGADETTLACEKFTNAAA